MTIVRAAVLLLMMAGCSNGSREERRAQAGPHPSAERLLQIASIPAGKASFGQCAACHTIQKGGQSLAGPNLFGIVGAPIAQTRSRYGYTAALQSRRGIWNAKTLNAWLADPQTFAPGTKMMFAGVEDPLERADIIAYLQSQSEPRLR